MKGAELLADAAVTAGSRQASGTLLTTADRLEWRPDPWSIRAGWKPGNRQITDLRLLHIAHRRDFIAGRVRVLHLAASGGEIVAVLTSEAGRAPAFFAERLD
jgi:hypothetical protein